MELAEIKNNVFKKILLRKNIIILFVKAAIASGLLIYIISSVQPAKIFSALGNANYLFIVAAVLMVVPNVYLQYRKWDLTCKSVLNYDNRKIVFCSLLQGFTAGAFTPLRAGEYFGRAILFADKSLLQVTVATLLDKFFPLVILAFAGSLSSILFIYFFYGVTIYIALSLFLVFFIVFYFLIMLLISPAFWNNYLFNKIRESEKLHKIFRKFGFLKNPDRNYLSKMFMYSFLFYACFVLQYVILVCAFTSDINLVSYFWAAILVMFAKTFIPPVSLGELGIREGVSVFFLGQMGVGAAPAFNAAFFLYLINILIPAIAGSVLLFKKNND